MTREQIEEAVVEFLERREGEPTLRPEAFAAAWADAAPAVEAAIRSALDLEALFPGEREAPRAIGPYQIEEEIGRGGMGIVYRATRDGRTYALKLLPLAPIVGPHMLERFRREAGTLGRLSHPNIVRVHDTGMHEEMPYLVMDHVEGRPLQHVTASLSLQEAVTLAVTLVRTIAAAHDLGVLHRDLKPQNVVVRADGTPVLLDFGLSITDDLPTLTTTGEVLGTPRYMAPEQMLGQPVDARTDVYALGLLLYELVAGHPARGDSTRDTLNDRVRRGVLRRPRLVNGAIPRALERIILTALARDPARRYATAIAMAEDLERFQRGERVWARPPGLRVAAIESAREQPGRTWILAAAVTVAVSVTGLWMQHAGAQRARLEAAPHVDRAITAWLEGDSTAARAALGRVRRLDPRDPTLQLLDPGASSHAGARETPCLRAAREGLRLFENEAYAPAITRLRTCESTELRPSFIASVVGLAAAGAGDHSLAVEELTMAARLLPRSARIHRALGRACDRLGRFDDALRAYRRAAELTSDPAAVWNDIASVHLRQRDLAAGLVAVARAESLSSGENPAILRTRGSLEIHAGLHAEGRRRMERLLELDPRDASAQFQMGFSFDYEHRVVEAERAYRRALAIEPKRVDALVCMANLHVGASRGHCRGCDSVYAAHPRYLDLERAEHYLLRALDADRGESEWVVNASRDVALKLPQRASVIALLERLTSVDERTAAVLRLEDLLRRLRLVGG